MQTTEPESIEDMLSDLPPRAWFNVQSNAPGAFVATIQMPKELGKVSRFFTGTGVTRSDAIRDALKAATNGGT